MWWSRFPWRRVSLGSTLVVAAVVGAFALTGHKRGESCGRVCRQDIVATTYYAVGQLDCDGQSSDLGPCGNTRSGGNGATDELQDLNRPPRLRKLEQERDGGLTVTLDVFFVGSM